MAALWNRAGHHIFALWFLLLSFFFFFFSSPNLSGRRVDVYRTSTHGVALVRIQDACLKCATPGSLAIQDAKTMQKIAISAPSQNLNCIFATKACIDSWKKNLLSSNTSSTCPRNKMNFGPLTVEIGSVVWGIPKISMGFPSWQHYCTALQQWASANFCGIEPRAPPIFGRAAITLGIGPHSSWDCVIVYLCMCVLLLCQIYVVSSVLCQEIGQKERLQNDLFCMKWDIKP